MLTRLATAVLRTKPVAAFNSSVTSGQVNTAGGKGNGPQEGGRPEPDGEFAVSHRGWYSDVCWRQGESYHLDGITRQVEDMDSQKQQDSADRPPKEQDGDMSRFHKTKFPFAATINGKPVTVWPDRIEREGDSPPG